MSAQPAINDSSYLAILDALDAVVYVADLETYELLFLNRKARETFGGSIGETCWHSLQKDQAGPCSFCTNQFLLNEQGQPSPPYVWEFQNTLNGEWWECRDQAVKWSDGRYVRLEIATICTQRKLAEEGLKRYQHIVSASDDHMSFLDRNYIYQTVNKAYLKAHQKTYEGIVGCSVVELLGADIFNNKIKAKLDRCLAGETIRYQDWFAFPGSGSCFMDIQYVPHREEDGTVSGIILSSHDQTELELSRLKTLAQEIKYRTLLDGQRDAIFLHKLRPEGFACFSEVNQAAVDRYGYSRDEFVRVTPADITLKEDVAGLGSKENLQALKEQRHRLFETTHITKAGEYIPVEISATVIDLEGVSYILSHVRDISERKEAESQRERLQRAIEQSGELIVITDADGRIQYVNPAVEAITGYSAAEVLGENPRLLQSGFHDQDFYRDLWDRLTSGQTWHGRLRNKKKDGSVYTEEATISPVIGEKGAIVNYVAAKKDITEQLKKDAQLKQSHKMEALGTLVGGVAHNFNNILAIVLGSLEMMQRKSDQPAIEKYIDQSKTACLRARDLVIKLFSYCQQSECGTKQLSLPSVIDETIALLYSTLPESISVERDISLESLQTNIEGDASAIQECLINICNNAVYAMEGQGVLSLKADVVTVRAEDIPQQYSASPGIFVRIGISDSGCGMDEKTQERIFDAFFTTKPVNEGTGLGLSTVQGIVRNHQGLIKLQSSSQQGSTFELYFPAVETSLPAQKAENVLSEKSPAGAGAVLLVEDDLSVAQLEEEMLEELGYQATVMTDSRQALEHFREHSDHYRLLISDQSMPGLCGIELIRAVRKIRPELPVILCTGYSHLVNEAETLSVRIDAVCAKPLKFSTLAQTMATVLNE